jgi:hypothetical protein
VDDQIVDMRDHPEFFADSGYLARVFGEEIVDVLFRLDIPIILDEQYLRGAIVFESHTVCHCEAPGVEDLSSAVESDFRD